MSDIIYDQAHDVWVRADSHDLKSALEVRPIVRKLDPQHGDLVMDVGGHIGAFARLCLKTGASCVTVEPEDENIEVMHKNVGDFPGGRVWKYALTDDPDMLAKPSVTLWKNVKGTHTGLHTLAPVKGREPVEVPVMSFREALEHVDPTILKVDIEGGEWALNFENLPRRIRALHVEMHMIPKSWGGREKAPVLHQLILDQGFTCIVEPRFNTLWGTHPIYVREAS